MSTNEFIQAALLGIGFIFLFWLVIVGMRKAIRNMKNIKEND